MQRINSEENITMATALPIETEEESTQSRKKDEQTQLINATLSDRAILAEIEKGNVVIEPFSFRHLSPCSYDVSLGPFYYRPRCRYTIPKAGTSPTPVASTPPSELSQASVLNPWCEEHVKDYWSGPHKATGVGTEPEGRGRSGATNGAYALPPNALHIVIQPGETILAHTLEFIGGRHHITTMMKTRSSLGRCGVCVCKAAGWGDIGFVNRWTMEITNFADTAIVLPVGARIATIVFLQSGVPLHSYEERGKYQQGNDVEELRRNWTPEQMLPRLHMEETEVVTAAE